jgi:AcrR family transcriptional regulator
MMERKARVSRLRRTNAELEKSIDEAVIKIVTEEGFQSLSLLKVAKQAKVEITVLTKRFDTLEGLIKHYAAKSDYWMTPSLALDDTKTPKENIKLLFTGLINHLYDNEFMQKFLLWELADENIVTRRMAAAREAYSIGIIDFYRKEFRKASIEFQPVVALIISGIYYLALHRKISTFALVDFDTPKGKEQLIQTVIKMVDELFPGR